MEIMLETELDEAKAKAMEFTNGLACLWHIQSLIQVGEKSKPTYLNRSLTFSERKQALADARRANQQLVIVAEARAVCGISA